MLSNNVFYHGIIRKTIVAFGTLFSSIYIDRKEGGSVTGNTVQRLQVPLAYAPKEKWIVRIDSDPSLENQTYTTLPRLSFEITGYSYDSSRKTGRMQNISCQASDGVMHNVFSPVPYNIDVSLYILTKTQEDALQIIEQILPTFTPEYTLSISTIPEMNIIQDIPVILNSISVQDDYDGDFQTRRFVTHTLTFTLKTFLYGNVNTGKVITDITSNIASEASMADILQTYNVVGNKNTSAITSELWIDSL